MIARIQESESKEEKNGKKLATEPNVNKGAKPRSNSQTMLLKMDKKAEGKKSSTSIEGRKSSMSNEGRKSSNSQELSRSPSVSRCRAESIAKSPNSTEKARNTFEGFEWDSQEFDSNSKSSPAKNAMPSYSEKLKVESEKVLKDSVAELTKKFEDLRTDREMTDSAQLAEAIELSLKTSNSKFDIELEEEKNWKALNEANADGILHCFRCFEIFEINDIIHLECGHSYCNSCFLSYLESDFRKSNEAIFYCPEDGCHKRISDDIISIFGGSPRAASEAEFTSGAEYEPSIDLSIEETVNSEDESQVISIRIKIYLFNLELFYKFLDVEFKLPVLYISLFKLI